MSYAKPNRRTLDIPAYNLRRSKLIASVVPEGLQPDLDILGIHASQGAILSRNSHIPGILSITSLESKFCGSSSQRHPVTPTFPGFSVASRLESKFYRQLADSRDFTEIARKLNAKNPDQPNPELAPPQYRFLPTDSCHALASPVCPGCHLTHPLFSKHLPGTLRTVRLIHNAFGLFACRIARCISRIRPVADPNRAHDRRPAWHPRPRQRHRLGLRNRRHRPPHHLARQQTLAVLGKAGRVPRMLAERQSHEPAKQQVVLQLLDRNPLTLHRVQHLQQKRTTVAKTDPS